MKSSPEVKALGWAILAVALSCGSAGLAASFIQRIPASSVTAFQDIASPRVTLAEINQGHEYFGQSCALCHGDDATGDEGPDLHQLPISNAFIAATIKKGITGQMPSFAKKYNGQQTAALIAYLRSLP